MDTTDWDYFMILGFDSLPHPKPQNRALIFVTHLPGRLQCQSLDIRESEASSLILTSTRLLPSLLVLSLLLRSLRYCYNYTTTSPSAVIAMTIITSTSINNINVTITTITGIYSTITITTLTRILALAWAPMHQQIFSMHGFLQITAN